jgi:ribonuclease HI
MSDFEEHKEGKIGHPLQIWPRIFTLHGIAPSDARILKWRQDISPDWEYDKNKAPVWTSSVENFRDDQGRHYICTDGSCFNQSNLALRFAGVGIYAGPGASWNCDFLLGGPIQSSERAELRGIVHVLESVAEHQEAVKQQGGVHLILDNEWVASTAIQLLEHDGDPRRLEHSDLWLRAQKAIDSINDIGAIDISWAPGHVNDVDTGDDADKVMRKKLNDGADDAAKQGAKKHAFPMHACEYADRRVKATAVMQRFIATMISMRRDLDKAYFDKAKKEAPRALEGPPAKRPRTGRSVHELVKDYPGYPWQHLLGGAPSPWQSVDISFTNIKWAWAFPPQAVVWYWTQLQWPQISNLHSVGFAKSHAGGAYKGCSWQEYALDFYFCTSFFPKAAKTTSKHTLKVAASVFAQATKKIADYNNLDPWVGTLARVSTLTPFGQRAVINGTWRRPALRNNIKIGSALARLHEGAQDVSAVLSEKCEQDFREDLPNRKLFDPVRTAFLSYVTVSAASARPPGQQSIMSFLGKAPT